MSESEDRFRLSAPNVFVVRMVVFLALAGLVGVVIQKQILAAFWVNPALNALIFFVLFVGIILAFRQVFRLYREVRWANSVRRGAAGAAALPNLLAPMAALLGDRVGRGSLSTLALRSVLDSIGARLDEARDMSRYLTGLLVFLGLLGTFWGLIETVSSVGNVIEKLPTGGDNLALFDELKRSLAAPLAGMGISFSSSLFGLAGSLVLGFLDLQASQAQNRFFYELENWLSANTEDIMPGPIDSGADVRIALERLTAAVHEVTSGRHASGAIASLAEGVQALVQHMRSEQQMIRNWVEAQADQQNDIKRLLERLSVDPGRALRAQDSRPQEPRLQDPPRVPEPRI